MKFWRKTIVAVVLMFVMCFMTQTNVNAGQLNTTESLEWNKSYNIDIDGRAYYLYNMSLQQSGRVNFTINAEIENSSYVSIYDTSGERVWYVWVSKGLNNYAVNLLAGDYTVELCEEYSWGEFKGSFVPSFVASGESVNEAYMNKNNQLGTATGYTIGQSVKAQFAINDNTDIYKVKVSKSGYLTMDFYSEINSFDMTLSCPDEDVTYKVYNIPLGTSSYKYFVPKGTYYISFEKNDYSGTYTFNSKLSGVTTSSVKSVKNLKGKKAKVTWAKKANVDGYQVQVATNSKFTKNKKAKTISGSSVRNYTFTKLKKDKTYYVRVRTYKICNGKKYYSNWSSAKKVKIKK